jgi:diamine N-acetyltransferase
MLLLGNTVKKQQQVNPKLVSTTCSKFCTTINYKQEKGFIVTVILKELTKDNWEACIDLKVHPEQKNFVASNLYSIAESQFYPGCIPLAVYDDETLVGFIMYEPDPESSIDGVYFISRLMVDRHYQSKGYGRMAMQQVIERLKKSSDCRAIRTSYVPENTVAAKLYLSFGFMPTGEVEDGEIIVQLSQ